MDDPPLLTFSGYAAGATVRGSRNPRATQKDDTGHHGTTPDDMLVCRKPAQEAKDDMRRHRATPPLGGMEWNNDVR